MTTIRQERILALRQAMSGPLGAIERREAIEKLQELELAEELEQRNASPRPELDALEQPNPLEEHGASVRAEEKPPTVAEIIGADLEQRAAMVAELEELRAIRAELQRIARFDSVATTLYKARGRAIAKRDRLASTRTMQQSNAELAAGGEAEELRQALEFIRKHNPLRRAILAKVQPRAGGIPGDGWDASSISD